MIPTASLSRRPDDRLNAAAGEREAPFTTVSWRLGDEDALVRVFVNVVDNAIKYTRKGEVTVAVDEEGAQGTLSVLVRDTGIGLTSADAVHAFDRFYRGDESRSSAGAGLGLSIARQIVEAHHGSITLTVSETGTTCRVVLPATAPSGVPEAWPNCS